MKKILLTSIIISFTLLHGFGQKLCDVKNHYEDFVLIQPSSFNGKGSFIKRVIETNRKSCFSDLINHNKMFIEYLLINFSSNSNYQYNSQFTDSITLKKTYFLELKKDSLFNSTMHELITKSIDCNTPKDTIKLDNMLNVAVKYFSIRKLNDDGSYVGKVCIGLNDIKKTESARKPFVEAFCFSSILKHYQSEEFNLHEEFVEAIKELYKVNLGLDKNEKLLRAQGAMFMLMKNNESLIKMLKSEYERQKIYLPFILIEK